MLPHRIASGAIVPHKGRILLVRYAPPSGGSYLVAPGGKVEHNESVADAAVRETREETGLLVTPRKILFVEDLLGYEYKMCKVWILCDLIGGELRATADSRKEGIIEAAWFAPADLVSQRVFPPILTHHEWSSFISPSWNTTWANIRNMDY